MCLEKKSLTHRSAKSIGFYKIQTFHLLVVLMYLTALKLSSLIMGILVPFLRADRRVDPGGIFSQLTSERTRGNSLCLCQRI